MVNLISVCAISRDTRTFEFIGSVEVVVIVLLDIDGADARPFLLKRRYYFNSEGGKGGREGGGV